MLLEASLDIFTDLCIYVVLNFNYFNNAMYFR